MSPVTLGERVSLLTAGLMRIAKVRLDDRGKYLCWVNNSAGEETIQVTLTVTGQYYLSSSFILYDCNTVEGRWFKTSLETEDLWRSILLVSLEQDVLSGNR